MNLYELSAEEIVTFAFVLSIELTRGLTADQQELLGAFLAAISDNIALISSSNALGDTLAQQQD